MHNVNISINYYYCRNNAVSCNYLMKLSVGSRLELVGKEPARIPQVQEHFWIQCDFCQQFLADLVFCGFYMLVFFFDILLIINVEISVTWTMSTSVLVSPRFCSLPPSKIVVSFLNKAVLQIRIQFFRYPYPEKQMGGKKTSYETLIEIYQTFQSLSKKQ